jgi:hypothetical protein
LASDGSEEESEDNARGAVAEVHPPPKSSPSSVTLANYVSPRWSNTMNRARKHSSKARITFALGGRGSWAAEGEVHLDLAPNSGPMRVPDLDLMWSVS